MLNISKLQMISLSWILFDLLFYLFSFIHFIVLLHEPELKRTGLFCKGMFIFTYFKPILIDSYQG